MHKLWLVFSLCMAASLLTACHAPQDGDAEITIATDKIGGYNPVNGYAMEGVSPFYDGLLRPEEDSGKGSMPELVPALAAHPPEVSSDLRTWTIKLRHGVTFSNDTTLTAKDVAATYKAVLDPRVASEVYDSFRIIKQIDTVDDDTIVFHLKEPTASFASRLTLGILPAEAIEKGQPAADWAVNSKPLGTGPYTLTSLKGDTAILTARNDYWRIKPQLEKVAIQAFDDTSALTHAIQAGHASGGIVPPREATAMQSGKFTLVTARSADWRGLSLPSDNPFTREAKVRLALNIGIDRKKIIDQVLGGFGIPASTPAGAFLGKAFNPQAQFSFNRDKAKDLLDEAGWQVDAKGIRHKNGTAAKLVILYPAGDTLRGDIAAEMTKQLQALGVDASSKSAPWDHIMPRMHQDAVVYAGGDQPFNIDHQFRSPLHTRTETSGFLDNPSNIEVSGLDKLIDQAAREADSDKSAAMYRQIQALYVKAPSWLIVGFLTHTYIHHASDWQTTGTTFEPHLHGSDWGPWWNLPDWKKHD